MMERRGRSSALDRAESLLASYKNRTDNAQIRPHVSTVAGSARLHRDLQGLSDLSSLSSADEQTDPDATKPQDSMGSPAECNKSQSAVGGGPRLLKKPPPGSNSLLMQTGASSHQTSTTAALRPAEHARSTQYERNPAKHVISEPELSPPFKAPLLHPQSPGEQNLKEMSITTVDPTVTANSSLASDDEIPHFGFRPKTRASAKSLRVCSTSPERLSSPDRTPTPQCPPSFLSEELSIKCGSEDAHSVSSDDFMKNVMTIDDLSPVTSETSEKEREIPATPKEVVLEKFQSEEEEEEVPNYESDFLAASIIEEDSNPISVQLQQLERKEDSTEVKDDANYSRCFPEDCSSSSPSSDQTCPRDSRGRGSSSSCRSHSSLSSCHTSIRPGLPEKTSKEAAVQTQSHPLSYTIYEGIPGMTLIELLKNQLAMTRTFMDRSHHFYCSLTRSLEPPNYRYTTLAQLTRNRNQSRGLKEPGSAAGAQRPRRRRVTKNRGDAPPAR